MKARTFALLSLITAMALLVPGGVEFSVAQSQPPSFLPLYDQSSTGFTTGGHAHTIILFIGDGMGEGQRTTGRWLNVGQNGALAMDAMPFSGWSRTAPANSAVTDSAAGGTALATGVKTNNGMIAMDPDQKPLTTILERAQVQGMAVGLGGSPLPRWPTPRLPPLPLTFRTEI